MNLKKEKEIVLTHLWLWQRRSYLIDNSSILGFVLLVSQVHKATFFLSILKVVVCAYAANQQRHCYYVTHIVYEHNTKYVQVQGLSDINLRLFVCFFEVCLFSSPFYVELGPNVHSVGWITLTSACDAGGRPRPLGLSLRPQERRGNEVGRMIYHKQEVNNIPWYIYVNAAFSQNLPWVVSTKKPTTVQAFLILCVNFNFRVCWHFNWWW